MGTLLEQIVTLDRRLIDVEPPIEVICIGYPVDGSVNGRID